MSAPDDAELLAQIAAAPDEVAPYLVYADVLQERDDPRGELITVQIALETATGHEATRLQRRNDALMAAHGEEWFGAFLAQRNMLVVRWARGFIHAARVLYDAHDVRQIRGEWEDDPDLYDGDDGGDALEALDALLEVPDVASTLAELRFGPRTPTAGSWPAAQPFVDRLAARPMPALRRLYLHDGDVRGIWAAGTPVDLAPLAGVAALEELVVHGPIAQLSWRAPPAALRRLELRSAEAEVASLDSAQTWPALEELALWGPTPGPLASLAPARFPKLRRLGLVGTRHTDALARELVALPIARQLDAIDLSGGTLTPAGSRALRGLRDDATCDVRRNVLPKSDAAALASRGWPARAQRRGKQPWLDRGELRKLHARLIKLGGVAREATGPRVAASQLRGVLEAAEAGDARWAHEWHAALIEKLAPDEAHAARLALAATWEAELAPDLRATGPQLFVRIADSFETRDKLDDTECWRRRAAALAGWFRDSELEIRALAQVATLCVRRGAPEEAVPLLARVTEHYKRVGNRANEAWALRQQGNAELVRSAFTAAETFYRAALARYRELDKRADEGIVLSELAGVLWSRQDYAGAEAMLREAITCGEPGSLAVASTYYNLAAILNNGGGRGADSRAAATEALGMFRKHRHRHGESQALSILGELAQRRNDHAEAERSLDAALGIERELGLQRDLGVTLGNLSRVALDLGDFARARACCDEAIELHRASGNKYNEGMQLLGLCDAALGEGHDAEASAHVVEALVPLRAIAAWPAISALRLREGQIAQRAGDDAAAEAAYREAMRDAERGNYPELIGWAEMWLATLFASRGRAADAAAELARGRARLPAASVQGAEAIAACEAVLARHAGAGGALPNPRSFGARMFVVVCEAHFCRTVRA